MLCTRCLAVDFQCLKYLPAGQQQRIRGCYFGDVHYWRKGGDGDHYYYYFLHDDFMALSVSVDQGCHLCAVIHTSLSSPPGWWRTKTIDKSIAMNQSIPIVLRSWGGQEKKERNSFAQKLAEPVRHLEFAVFYGEARINFGLIENLSGISTGFLIKLETNHDFY